MTYSDDNLNHICSVPIYKLSKKSIHNPPDESKKTTSCDSCICITGCYFPRPGGFGQASSTLAVPKPGTAAWRCGLGERAAPTIGGGDVGHVHPDFYRTIFSGPGSLINVSSQKEPYFETGQNLTKLQRRSEEQSSDIRRATEKSSEVHYLL